MANLVYPNFLAQLASGTISIMTGHTCVALVSGSYTPSTGHRLFSDIVAHQAHDALGGYISGGTRLQGKTLSIVNSTATYDASDVTFNPATITAAGAVVYHSGNSEATKYLITFKDFGGNQSSTNATFQIVWNNTQGLLTLGAN